MKKVNENRVLIYNDLRKQIEFSNSVESVQHSANDLIILFENFQPYLKIKSLSDFEKLVINPLAEFDETLQTFINFEQSGGKKGNPEIIAKMFDIDRNSFISIVKGEKIISGTCKPCENLKVIKNGESVLNYATFQQYQEYLIFDNSRFTINEIAVDKKNETFKTFGETPRQIEIYNHWINLCNMLNNHAKKGYIGTTDLDKLTTLFKNRLKFSFQAGELAVDEQSLLSEIKNIKN
jgi:hypothetical protein